MSPGSGANGETATFSFHTTADGPSTIAVNGTPLDDKEVAEAIAKAKASGADTDRHL